MNSNFTTTALLGVALNRILSSVSLAFVVNLSLSLSLSQSIIRWFLVFFALFLLILWVLVLFIVPLFVVVCVLFVLVGFWFSRELLCLSFLGSPQPFESAEQQLHLHTSSIQWWQPTKSFTHSCDQMGLSEYQDFTRWIWERSWRLPT